MTVLAANPHKSSLHKTVLLVAIATVLFSVPYFFSVVPTVSRSYVVGFNNRAAVLIFVLGSVAFALFTKGNISETENTNQSLTFRSLLVGVALAGLLAISRVMVGSHGAPGNEAAYFLNRMQLVAAGLRPYFDVEFLYGPILLYPPLWIAHISHISISQGYCLTWIFEWIVGTAMSWFIVHSLDFSIRRRLLLFVLLFTTQLSMLRTGGENYAPLRVYCAAFLVIVIHKVWRQTRKPLLTSVLAILAVGIALLVSPEQAIGVVLGMFAYLLILMSLAKSHFTWMAFLLYILGSGICFAYAVRNGLFFSFRDFASGGYSYPVVPSPTTVVALLAYVVAACSLVNALHKRRVESVITPLVLTGFAMIPTVLGRCDSLHICAAMPAFVVGAASISAMPSLRRYWVPSAFIFLFVVPSFLRLPDRMLNRIPGLRSEETTDQLASQSTRQPTTGSDAIAASDLPCDQKYFAPSFEPWPGATFLPECLDTGYYRWVEMVITPRSIDRKLQELKDRPTQKLLLNNQPLEAEFGVQQADMAGLRFEAVAPWVPRVRNPPVTFNPIINYIRLHYVPGPIVAGGRLRIWLPIERSNLTLQ